MQKNINGYKKTIPDSKGDFQLCELQDLNGKKVGIFGWEAATRRVLFIGDYDGYVSYNGVTTPISKIQKPFIGSSPYISGVAWAITDIIDTDINERCQLDNFTYKFSDSFMMTTDANVIRSVPNGTQVMIGGDCIPYENS